MAEYSLAELCIAAAAQAWADDGEVLATGITPLPRLAAGLAKLTLNDALMMTDSENYFVSEPVPLGPRGDYRPRVEGWAPYARTFDNLWSGKRHAFVAPTQIDRFGQTNISTIGPREKPKAALLGARGFPVIRCIMPIVIFFHRIMFAPLSPGRSISFAAPVIIPRAG